MERNALEVMILFSYNASYKSKFHFYFGFSILAFPEIHFQGNSWRYGQTGRLKLVSLLEIIKEGNFPHQFLFKHSGSHKTGAGNDYWQSRALFLCMCINRQFAVVKGRKGGPAVGVGVCACVYVCVWAHIRKASGCSLLSHGMRRAEQAAAQE